MKNAYGKMSVEVIANNTPVGSWFIESNDNGIVAVFTVTSDMGEQINVNAWGAQTGFKMREPLGVERSLFDSFVANGKITKIAKQVALDLIDNLKGNYHDTTN